MDIKIKHLYKLILGNNGYGVYNKAGGAPESTIFRSEDGKEFMVRVEWSDSSTGLPLYRKSVYLMPVGLSKYRGPEETVESKRLELARLLDNLPPSLIKLP